MRSQTQLRQGCNCRNSPRIVPQSIRQSIRNVAQSIGPEGLSEKPIIGVVFDGLARVAASFLDEASAAMPQHQVFLALHLDQARFGSGEHGTVTVAIVEIDDRDRGREDKLDRMIVKLIDQLDKA